jgi:hypothetical protein
MQVSAPFDVRAAPPKLRMTGITGSNIGRPWSAVRDLRLSPNDSIVRVDLEPTLALDESTEAEIERCVNQARSIEAFMGRILRDLPSTGSTKDTRPEEPMSLNADLPLAYDDEIANEINQARTSPSRPQEMLGVKSRHSPVEIIALGQWLANILASGVLGNAAWDAIKAATKSYRSRQHAGAPAGPLSLGEARVVAYYALLLNMTLRNDSISTSSQIVELRNSITEHRWEFVFDHGGRWWLVGVPHKDPTMVRISVIEMFPYRAEHLPARHIPPRRKNYLGHLLRKLSRK